MPITSSSSTGSSDSGEADVNDEKRLEAVLKEVPRGAFALAGAAVAILVLAYLFLYFVVFLPRGPIG